MIEIAAVQPNVSKHNLNQFVFNVAKDDFQLQRYPSRSLNHLTPNHWILWAGQLSRPSLKPLVTRRLLCHLIPFKSIHRCLLLLNVP